MKQCTRCKKVLHDSAFYKHARSKRGLFSACIKCQNKLTIAWLKEHPKKVKQYAKRYRLGHIEERRKEDRERYWANRKQILKQKADKRKYDGDKIRARERIWGKTPVARFHAYKRNAKTRNLEFSLEKKIFLELIKQKCIYCGREDSLMGLDRLDSKKGYFIENVKPCCPTCNTMKWASTKENFLKKCLQIVIYHNLKVDGSKLENNL